MPTVNKIREHRNNEERATRVNVGELTALNDAPKKNVDYVVTALRPGTIIKDVVVSTTSTTAVSATVTIKYADNTSAATGAMSTTSSTAAIDSSLAGKVVPASGAYVVVTLGDDLTIGDVIVAVEVVDTFHITGGRVAIPTFEVA